MRRSVTAVSLSLLLSFGLLACGSGDEATQSTVPAAAAGPVPRLDPCALISQAEIEAVVGLPVAAMTPETSAPAGGLQYYSCRSDDVHIDIEAWSSEENARASFEFGGDYPAIDDLGLPARTTQPLGELDVLAGQFVVTVDLFTNQDQAAQLQAAKEISRIVIGRLP